MNTKRSEIIKKICGIGVFAALAYITTFICKLIPNVAGFLSIDAKDAVIAIASFVYGPLAAPIIALIVAFVEFITISTTGIWGLVMNFVMLVNKVRLRTLPSDSSAYLNDDELKAAETVEIRERRDKWVRIKAGNAVGWVPAETIGQLNGIKFSVF